MDKRYEEALDGLLPEGVTLNVYAFVHATSEGVNQVVTPVLSSVGVTLEGDIDNPAFDDLWDNDLIDNTGDIKSRVILDDDRILNSSLGPVIQAIKPLVEEDAAKLVTEALKSERGYEAFGEGLELVIH